MTLGNRNREEFHSLRVLCLSSSSFSESERKQRRERAILAKTTSSSCAHNFQFSDVVVGGCNITPFRFSTVSVITGPTQWLWAVWFPTATSVLSLPQVHAQLFLFSFLWSLCGYYLLAFCELWIVIIFWYCWNFSSAWEFYAFLSLDGSCKTSCSDYTGWFLWSSFAVLLVNEWNSSNKFFFFWQQWNLFMLLYVPTASNGNVILINTYPFFVTNQSLFPKKKVLLVTSVPGKWKLPQKSLELVKLVPGVWYLYTKQISLRPPVIFHHLSTM